MMKTHSSKNVPIVLKMNEYFRMWQHDRRRSLQHRDWNSLFDRLRSYERVYEDLSGFRFRDACIFEIGYGARPYSLITLLCMGFNAHGIDYDLPALCGNAGELFEIARRNGLERMLKTLACLPAVKREQVSLKDALTKRGYSWQIDKSKFLCGKAGDLSLEENSLDFIYSEDVFEHIPLPELEALLGKMTRWLKPRGLAWIRPNIFTGITGGHLFEWSSVHVQNTGLRRKTMPWQHLRTKVVQAPVYLNRLTRRDYRTLFGRHFQILREEVLHPGLGESYWSEALQAELGYERDELFSNQVLFLLRPKTTV